MCGCKSACKKLSTGRGQSLNNRPNGLSWQGQGDADKTASPLSMADFSFQREQAYIQGIALPAPWLWDRIENKIPEKPREPACRAARRFRRFGIPALGAPVPPQLSLPLRRSCHPLSPPRGEFVPSQRGRSLQKAAPPRSLRIPGRRMRRPPWRKYPFQSQRSWTRRRKPSRCGGR